MILRDYQTRGVMDLRAAYARGLCAPLYVAPTGSGKTILFTHIAQSAVARGNTVWILVHRQELIHQTSAALTALGVHHGLIAAGRYPGKAPVQVASVQTVARRLGGKRLPPAPSLMIVDEAHHAAAGSWRRIIQAMPDTRLLGVTATPLRLDGKGLGAYFDALILGPATAELIEQGWLARPVVYAPPIRADLDGLHTVAGDYNRGEAAERMDKATITGDAVGHYKRICDGVPALAFCNSIKHAQHVAESFRGAGYRAASIDGTMRDWQRARLIADLGSGALHVLTSCELVSEGIDIPVVTAAILLRPTQSLGLYRQQVGRVLRPAPGKTRAVILDHVGNCLRHGLPDDEPEWSLEGALRRKDKLAAPAVRQCPACFAAHRPASVCPICGHVYEVAAREVEEVAGDLQEIDAVTAARMRRQQVGRARTREELEVIARERGYNPGWVHYMMAARERRGYHGPIDPRGPIHAMQGLDAPAQRRPGEVEQLIREGEAL